MTGTCQQPAVDHTLELYKIMVDVFLKLEAQGYLTDTEEEAILQETCAN
jgi:hypothetical protein